MQASKSDPKPRAKAGEGKRKTKMIPFIHDDCHMIFGRTGMDLIVQWAPKHWPKSRAFDGFVMSSAALASKLAGHLLLFAAAKRPENQEKKDAKPMIVLKSIKWVQNSDMNLIYPTAADADDLQDLLYQKKGTLIFIPDVEDLKKVDAPEVEASP